MAFAGIAVAALFALASASDRTLSHYWHRWWFIALVAFFGLMAVAGLWIVLAGAIPRLPPKGWTQAHEEEARSLSALADLTFTGVSTTTPMNLLAPGGALVGHGIYCHAVVEASSKLDPVKGEAIRLERKSTAGRFETVENFKPPQELRWDKTYVDPEEYRSETIYPDVPGRLNIVNTESHDPECVTHLSVRRHGPGMGVTKLLPGDYRLTVRVSAPGARNTDGSFLIHAGRWDELAVAMESAAARKVQAEPLKLAAANRTDEARKFIENLARMVGAMKIGATIPSHRQDDLQDYFEIELPKARERVLHASDAIRYQLAERCGYDVAALYESDLGVDARYEGPMPPESQNDLKLFISRRALRIEEIIKDIRRGAIHVKPSAEASRAAMSAMQTELKTNRETLDRAITSGYWWDTQYTGLPADAWTDHEAEIAADESALGRAIRRTCQEAYVATHQLNVRANQLRIRGAVLEADEVALLTEARDKIALALSELKVGLAD